MRRLEDSRKILWRLPSPLVHAVAPGLVVDQHAVHHFLLLLLFSPLNVERSLLIDRSELNEVEVGGGERDAMLVASGGQKIVTDLHLYVSICQSLSLSLSLS